MLPQPSDGGQGSRSVRGPLKLPKALADLPLLPLKLLHDLLDQDGIDPGGHASELRVQIGL